MILPMVGGIGCESKYWLQTNDFGKSIYKGLFQPFFYHLVAFNPI
jgi:hypothetical protein